jgi:hypothetical protein
MWRLHQVPQGVYRFRKGRRLFRSATRHATDKSLIFLRVFAIALRIRQFTDEVIQIGEGSLYPRSTGWN